MGKIYCTETVYYKTFWRKKLTAGRNFPPHTVSLETFRVGQTRSDSCVTGQQCLLPKEHIWTRRMLTQLPDAVCASNWEHPFRKAGSLSRGWFPWGVSLPQGEGALIYPYDLILKLSYYIGGNAEKVENGSWTSRGTPTEEATDIILLTFCFRSCILLLNQVNLVPNNSVSVKTTGPPWWSYRHVHTQKVMCMYIHIRIILSTIHLSILLGSMYISEYLGYILCNHLEAITFPSVIF